MEGVDTNSDITSKKNYVKVLVFRLVLVGAAADESEAENVDKVKDAPIFPEGPCLIPCTKVFLMDTFETAHELRDLL